MTEAPGPSTRMVSIPLPQRRAFAWACLKVWGERTGEDKLWLLDAASAGVSVPADVMEAARELLRSGRAPKGRAA